MTSIFWLIVLIIFTGSFLLPDFFVFKEEQGLDAPAFKAAFPDLAWIPTAYISTYVGLSLPVMAVVGFQWIQHSPRLAAVVLVSIYVVSAVPKGLFEIFFRVSCTWYGLGRRPISYLLSPNARKAGIVRLSVGLTFLVIILIGLKMSPIM